MLSEKLKEATKQNHQLLEKKLVANMRMIRSKDDYANLLSFFYGFFGGLEIEINKSIGLSNLPDYAQRRKTSALAYDLNQLAKDLPPLATGSNLPQITNHLQATGALYVIEGSTLGGKIISKMIGQQLNLTVNDGITFFESYGDQTEKMWQAFKQAIDRPIELVQEDVVIRAANETFTKFSEWFDQKE